MSDEKLSFLFAYLELFEEPHFLLDRAGNCVFMNQACLRFLDRSGTIDTVFAFWPTFDSSPAGREFTTTEFVFGDGNTYDVKLRRAALPEGHHLIQVLAGGPDGEGIGSYHVQRMETLGMMSSGIAHDVNNMLTGILGHSAYLMATLPKTGPHVDSLTAIEDGAKKAASMTRQILNFAKSDDSEPPSPVDLAKLVESTCNLLRGAISKQFRLSYEVPVYPLFVSAVEGQLTQILMNLVLNARDALAPDGEIQVSLRQVDRLSEGAASQLQGESSEHGYALLNVRDNGSGIPADLVEKIFEPYFSTKKGKGTGLGLATVSAIVHSAAGAIEVHSEVGKGTKIQVCLPLCQAVEEEQRRVEETPAEAQSGSGHVLVIDDEAPVRNVLSLSLARLGYSVELAESGNEGLEKFRQAPESYDLVILDMVMPGLSGHEVFFELQEIRPGTAVLISSAYSSDEAVQDILANGGRGFIQKPFSVEELSVAVRDCLEKKGDD